MIRKVALFCGIEVLTYCIMGNHFHILIKVPEKRDLTDSELVARFARLYPEPTKYQLLSPQMFKRRLQAGGEEAEALRQKYLVRMGDLSQFMKLLKQRFAIWYHKHHGTYGTLWADRFKSVLVEGKASALSVVSAYIDLNPVRAGLVADPKDYRFCGYAEAVSGSRESRVGLEAVMGSAGKALAAYRVLLFGVGSASRDGEEPRITREEALKVMERQKGELSTAVLLRCRMRYFTDGVVIGSKQFVREGIQAMDRGLKYPCKPHPLATRGLPDELWIPHRPRRAAFG
jgi:REP element-mobilizing transposase RayT